MSASRARSFVGRHPNASMFGAGAGAQAIYAARKSYKRKRMGIKARGRKTPRRAGGGRPPTTTSARVPSKFMVADRMSKFKKVKATKQKIPKSACVHYREFGQYDSEKCLWVNHEHWGSVDKLWYGISLGLAKLLLGKAGLYTGKSLEDPLIGPSTSPTEEANQNDNKSAGSYLVLEYTKEGTAGQYIKNTANIGIEDVGPSPDRYLSMDTVAKNIKASLVSNYQSPTNQKRWLSAASFKVANADARQMNIKPIYIQNLDDAEINVYVKSLLKFQNITLADHGVTGVDSTTDVYNKSAIDANPLVGRLYEASGHYANIDTELARQGAKSLDSFFGNLVTTGMTLLGHSNSHAADDIGRISNIPSAPQLYGNQAVKSGKIHIAPGGMKYHQTSYTLRKTFKDLAGSPFAANPTFQNAIRKMGRHSLFGLTVEHKHGEDTIKLGFNREIDMGCHIKYKRCVNPLKTNYTADLGLVETTIVPTDHAE